MGKFWVLFARPGQRVLVNQGGDMQVRPTPLDRRLTPLTPGQRLICCSYMHVEFVLALPACLPVCMSVCMSVHLSGLLFVCLSIYIYVSLPPYCGRLIGLPVCLSAGLSACLSVDQTAVCLSIGLSARLSIRLSQPVAEPTKPYETSVILQNHFFFADMLQNM